MATLGPDKIVKARKEHRCSLCGLRIRKGATYVYREGVEGRHHWRMKMHPVCEDATHDWDYTEWEIVLDPIDFRYHELYLRRNTVLNVVSEILRGGK